MTSKIFAISDFSRTHRLNSRLLTILNRYYSPRAPYERNRRPLQIHCEQEAIVIMLLSVHFQCTLGVQGVPGKTEEVYNRDRA